MAFGDLTWVHDGASQKDYWAFGQNGMLQPKRNRTISAILALEVTRPEAEKIIAMLKERTKDRPADFKFHEYTYNQIIAETGLNPDTEELKAIVILNPWAYIKIDHNIFKGKFDEIWNFDSTGKFIRLI